MRDELLGAVRPLDEHMAELVATYQSQLKALVGNSREGHGETRQDLNPRPKTNTQGAFLHFAAAEAAPMTLAVLWIYSMVSGLNSRQDFSVTCLPSAAKHRKFKVRASVTSLGNTEVMKVIWEPTERHIDFVHIYVENTDVARIAAESRGLEFTNNALDGGCVRITLPGSQALDLLAQPQLSDLTAERVTAMRARKRRSRRRDWHNEWLWNAVHAAPLPLDVTADKMEGPDDVSSPDVMRWRAVRSRQALFRDLLFRRRPNECGICGISEPYVLDAAHIVPHAQGGLACVTNGAILCANHHRAFDQKLYSYSEGRFTWAGPGPEPQLGRAVTRID